MDYLQTLSIRWMQVYFSGILYYRYYLDHQYVLTKWLNIIPKITFKITSHDSILSAERNVLYRKQRTDLLQKVPNWNQVLLI